MDEVKDSIQVSLVGLKNMASTHNWRLTFDVFEVDSYKVKNLVDQIDRDFHMFLVSIDNREEKDYNEPNSEVQTDAGTVTTIS